MRPGGMGAIDRSHEVDAQDQFEIGQLHLGERPVPQNPGVVHQNVQPSERIDCGGYDPLRSDCGVHAVVVGDGLSPKRADFVHDAIRH